MTANAPKIRVLIVDDSTFFREALTLHLSKENDIQVVGTSPDAYDAMQKIEELKPDVITLDIEMPGMNGIEFLTRVMPRFAIPVIVVSSLNGSVFEALAAGALDFVGKPDTRVKMGYDYFIHELKTKIRGAPLANRSILKERSPLAAGAKDSKFKVIALGASTGGTEALYEVLRLLPRTVPGIVLVQHMPAGFTRMYADRIKKSCVLDAKEAEHGDKVLPGRVLVAPGGLQMKLKKAGDEFFVECAPGEKVSGHCPSVDVLFHSVAEKAHAEAIGAIFTGMGSDGAKGLLEMRKNGARTLGQDEKTSVVYGMPKVAFDIGAVEKQLPLNRMAEQILKIVSGK